MSLPHSSEPGSAIQLRAARYVRDLNIMAIPTQFSNHVCCIYGATYFWDIVPVHNKNKLKEL